MNVVLHVDTQLISLRCICPTHTSVPIVYVDVYRFATLQLLIADVLPSGTRSNAGYYSLKTSTYLHANARHLSVPHETLRMLMRNSGSTPGPAVLTKGDVSLYRRSNGRVGPTGIALALLQRLSRELHISAAASLLLCCVVPPEPQHCSAFVRAAFTSIQYST